MFFQRLSRKAAHCLHASTTALTSAALLISASLLCPTAHAGHEAVSADAAALALAQGARVIDVRSPSAFAAGHLPGAAHLPRGAATLPVAQLERLVSDAGIDLSRTVLVMGEPGDAHAQALWHTLSAYASGRVLWLVGGALEWQLRGHPLTTHSALSQPVPQHLVAHQAEPAQVRMAGQATRFAATPAPAVRLSLSN